MNVTQRIVALERGLLPRGWPALSPWWLETLTSFADSGCRQLVVRAGRRAGKSSSLSRFAVAFALAFDAAQIPPGDIGVIAFISTTRDEAGQRLRTIKAILDVLGIPHRPIEHGLELVGRPIAFKVYVATVAGVSGFTAILVIADEVAKWRDSDSGANPASEVLASVRPTMATQPHARIILASSPLGAEDAHAKAYELGDTDHQRTAFAPTWIANPTVTEAQTIRDEPDPRVWAREYAAEPQSAKLAAFDGDAVARAFRQTLPPAQRWPSFGIIDASSGKKDSWAFAAAHWQETSSGERHLAFDYVGGFEASFWAQKSGEEIVRQVAREMRTRGVRVIYGDQRESLMISAAFTRHSMQFVELPWTAPRKERAVGVVRRWLHDGTILLPEHAKLRAELLSFEERITANGALTFAGGRGTSGHDDYVALLLTAAMAESEPKSKGGPPMPQGSPSHPNRMAEAMMRAAARERGELVNDDDEPPPERIDFDAWERDAGIRHPANLHDFGAGVSDVYRDAADPYRRNR